MMRADEEDKDHRFSTPQYRAPEQCDVRRGEIIGVGVDVWALGVSLYKLLFLRDLCGTPGEERLASLNFDPAKRLEASALPRMPPDSAASSAALVSRREAKMGLVSSGHVAMISKTDFLCDHTDRLFGLTQ